MGGSLGSAADEASCMAASWDPMGRPYISSSVVSFTADAGRASAAAAASRAVVSGEVPGGRRPWRRIWIDALPFRLSRKSVKTRLFVVRRSNSFSSGFATPSRR